MHALNMANECANVRSFTRLSIEEHFKRAMMLLDEYIAAKDLERYAMALARTYNKRRQNAYRAYLKQYDALQKESAFTEQYRRMLQDKLNRIA